MLNNALLETILSNKIEESNVTELLETTVNAFDNMLKSSELNIRFTREDIPMLAIYCLHAKDAISLGKAFGAKEQVLEEAIGTYNKVTEQMEKYGFTKADAIDPDKMFSYPLGMKLTLTGFDCYQINSYIEDAKNNIKNSGTKKDCRDLYKYMKKFNKKMDGIINDLSADFLEDNESIMEFIEQIRECVEE